MRSVITAEFSPSSTTSGFPYFNLKSNIPKNCIIGIIRPLLDRLYNIAIRLRVGENNGPISGLGIHPDLVYHLGNYVQHGRPTAG